MAGHNEHLLDHEYDGIQEYDNPTPRWWVWIFVATILFSVVYTINVGPVGSGAGRIADYEAEVAAARAREPQQPAAGASEADLQRLAGDTGAVQRGRVVFTANCASCHRPDGGGLIGPNLADEYWLHGGTLAQVRQTIAVGVLAKGMPGWERLLRPQQIDDVTVFVASLRGTSPANPKPPQGEPFRP